jgi:hypothetical protein
MMMMMMMMMMMSCWLWWLLGVGDVNLVYVSGACELSIASALALASN